MQVKSIFKKRTNVSFVAIATVLALASGGSTAALASQESQPTDMESIIASADNVNLENAAAVNTNGNEVHFSSEDVEVVIPKEADEPLELSTEEGDIAVSLPMASDASFIPTPSPSVVAFDNGDASRTAVVVYDEGSVQMNTVVDGPQAPQRFDYQLTLPEGAYLEQQENGAVLIIDESGRFFGGFAPAWAQDANGQAVPTQYEISGTTLSQYVDHTDAYAYPVVADPWWGKNLFMYVSRDSAMGDFRYNGQVSAWGALVLSGGGGVGGYLVGGHILRTSGWDEWVARYPAVNNKATLKQQYDCHVAAGSVGLIFTGPYNLERARANKPAWLAGIATHRCNW